ncbi:MAG: DMT family transporter [Parvibaculaceae bacterium]
MSFTAISPAPTAFKAGLVMILAMASFTAGDTTTKLMAGEVPVGQIIFCRGIVATSLTALLAGRALAQAGLVLQKGVLVRSLSDVTGTIFFITALMHMPIANLNAVMQAVPLLVTGFAAMFLGETVGWRRTAAILIGLSGVLLVVKPSPTNFTIYDGLSLGLIMAIALRDIFTRRLNFGVPTRIIVFANALFVMLSGLLLYPFEEWVALTPRHLILLACGGTLLTLGYVCMVTTVRMGDISTTAIYRYTVVLFALLSGMLVFGEFPDRWAIAGIALIVASGIYAMLREIRPIRPG